MTNRSGLAWIIALAMIVASCGGGDDPAEAVGTTAAASTTGTEDAPTDRLELGTLDLGGTATITLDRS